MSFVKMNLVQRLRSGNDQNSNAAQLQNLNRMIWFSWVDVRCDVVDYKKGLTDWVLINER